jgi:hypothetical protein
MAGPFRRSFCFMVVFSLLFTSGCIRCKIGTTRCDGNAAVACLSNGTWHKFLDCDQVARQTGEGPWSCQQVPRTDGQLESTCLPVKGGQ